jgi:hypothetical protein
MAVGEACAGGTALVQEQEGMRESGVPRRGKPLVPGRGDGAELVRRELGDGAHVARCVHHDLLVVESGIEVRNDPDAPSRSVGESLVRRDREGLRGRPVLSALAEGALVELLGARRLQLGVRGAGPLRTRRRDDDRPA